MNVRGRFLTILVFVVLQVVMVISGHYIATIKSFFALLGMSLSLMAGLSEARLERRTPLSGLGWGALTGGLSGLGGIAVSYILRDVPASLLVFGTAGSIVAGGIGGALSWLITLGRKQENYRS